VIRRVFRGRSPYGLLRYLYGEGRRNEHADPHLVASWDGDPAALEPDVDDACGTRAVGPLTRLLGQPVRGCDRLPERWVYHLVLRNDPGDRRLTDDEWAQVCAAAMDRTGIAPKGDAAGCRWVAMRHADDHIHLVATLAREDGRAPRLWNDYARLAEVGHQFERVFGLRSTAGRDDHTAASRPGVKEQQAAERMGRRVPPRVELRRKVRVAAAGTASLEEFTRRLAAQGVTVWPRMSELRPGEVTGYSVSLDGHRSASGQPVRFGGGKLAPDLSWPQLCARWGATVRGEGDGRSAGGHGVGVDPRFPGDQVWRDAESIVRTAATRLGLSSPFDDQLVATDAAWASSDLLAVVASVLERDGGGPLSSASELLDRAGRRPYGVTRERTQTGDALRAAARTLAVLSGAHRSDVARTTTIVLAFASLIQAVERLRSAQQRLHQAEAARDAAAKLQQGPAGRPQARMRRVGNPVIQAALALQRPTDGGGPGVSAPAPASAEPVPPCLRRDGGLRRGG
jgi:hypothetical protein